MKKILAIDDQKDNLTTISAVLKLSIPNSTILTALNGEEGIKIAKSEQPDIILLDIIMPKMDGYQVCEKLKAHTLTKHIPIILITAIKTDKESRVKGLNIGADVFLSKPIDPIELTAQVNVMLRIKVAEDKLRLEKGGLEEIVKERTSYLLEKNKKLQSEIKKRELAENALRSIATEFSALTGQEFFEKVCQHLTKTLNIDYAFIGEHIAENNRVLVKAGFGKGLALEQFEYDLENTPCENVVGKEICSYPSNIQILFPKDQLLIDMGIESYLGIPLFKSSGQPMGIMVLLDSKELINTEISISVLQIFSDRVVSELERMQVRESLVESEEKYRNLVERANDGICILQDGKVKFANSYLVNLWGGSIEEMMEKSFMEYIHEDERDRLSEYYSKRLAGEDVPSIYETILKHKQGRKVYAELSAGSITYEGKSADLVFIRDISERKIAEKALQESESRYRVLAENSTDTIWLMKLDGTFLYHSPAVMQLRGYTPEEANKVSMEETMTPESIKTLEIIFAEEDAKPMKERWNSLRFELEMYRKDGSKFWGEVSTKAVFDDNSQMIGFQGSTHDITKRKKIEANLQRLSTAVEQSPSVIVITDLDGKLEYVNPKYSSLTGYSFKEAMGMKTSLLKSGVQSKDFYKKLWNRISSGKEWKGEFHNRKKNGKFFWEQASISPIFDKEGAITNYLKVAEDITERKKAEEELRKNEAQLQVLLNTIPDLVWMKDSKGVYLFCNQKFEKFFGKSVSEICGKTDYDFLDKKLANFFKLKDQEAIDNGVPSINEEEVTYADDGHSEILETIKTPVYDPDGGILGVLGIARDITERKKAEKELKESETRFKALHNASFGGIAIHDLGIIKECNQGLSNMTGYSIEELIEMNGLLLISEESREKVMNNIKAQYEKPYEAIGLTKDGRKYPIRLEGQEIPYKGKKLRVVEFRDITEQKQSEKALKESEERFVMSMRASKDGLFDWDLTTNEIFYSENWKKMLGYEDDELLNVLSTWQNLTDDEGRDRSLKKMEWAIKNNIPRYEEEFKMKHKDGHWVNILSRPEFVYNDKKEAIRVVGTHVDVTKQRQYERNLKDALHKATESDRLKSAFLATMSHELRTPLNAIIGFSEIIKDDYSIEEIKNFNNHIHTSGKHLLTIVEDLFDLTLIESGQMTLRTTNEEIPKLLNNVFEIIKSEQQSLEKGHLELKLLIPDNCQNLVIFTDAFKLKQILINLLKNALKFTPKGIVEFGCKIVQEHKNKLVQFYVKDTGIGIPNDKHQLIFDAFRQVEDSHTRVYGGTGIGLSITKKLVEILDGKIILESVVDKGSNFYFLLPLILTKSVKLKNTHKETSFGHYDEIKNEDVKQKTILIVEDVESSFDLLKIILKDKKFNILWAKNGKEAIELCEKNTQIDLILMDLNMPVMNGYEATKHIKSLNPKIPIIAQTAYAISGDREKALKIGCDDYISKPIKKDKLLTKINNLLKII